MKIDIKHIVEENARTANLKITLHDFIGTCRVQVRTVRTIFACSIFVPYNPYVYALEL